MRQLIIAAMLCTFGACSCGPSPCATSGAGPGGTGGFGGAGGSGVDVTPLFVGQLDGVQVETSESFSSCTGEAVMVTGAEAEVLDPTNSKVASTVEGLTNGPGSVSVTVKFTPATPGPYHITVRFLPSSGTVQKDVLVAVDKATEAAHTAALSPDVMSLGCGDIDVDEGAAETVLCLTPTSGPGNALYAMQNGQTVGSPWPTNTFALSEGRVWTFSTLDQNLHLLGLGSNGSLTDLASTGLVDANVTRILASGDLALVLSSSGFVEAHYASDGGLSVSSNVGIYSPQYAQWVPDVGAQVYGYESPDVCSFSFAGGVTTPLNLDAGSCGFSGSTAINIIGFDDDGLWSQLNQNTGNTPDLITLDVTGWQTGQPRARSNSLSYSSQNPIGPWNQYAQHATPILYLGGQAGFPTDLYLPHFDGNEVTLTHYPFVGPNDAHADSKRLWKISNNTLTWWPR